MNELVMWEGEGEGRGMSYVGSNKISYARY